MQRILIAVVLLTFIALSTACTRRMAPFSPHRPNTEAHIQVTTNQECLQCHALKDVGKGHQASDNCMRCHRIVQGD